jgi:hypothetical protein
MARGTSLLELVNMLRNDVGRSSDVSVGVADLPELKQRINATYEFLYLDYDWPHMRQFFTRIPLNATQRYYDLPATLDYDRIERAVVWYNGRPIEISRGIAHEDYASFDSEAGETSAPVLKWDVRYTDNKEQIEVWPMPTSSGQELEFVGIKKFSRLVNDADICVLDDMMIVLRASAEILSRQGSKDAGLRLQESQLYTASIQKRTKGASRIRRVGQGRDNLSPIGGTPHFYVTVR